MRITLCIILAVVAELSHSQNTEEEPRLLMRKIRKLCRIFGQGRELSDEEARTLVFLQVQQVQGYPGVGSTHTSSDPLGGLCSSYSGGGGGGLLGGHGGLLGGVLGSSSGLDPPLGGVSQLGEILGGGPPRRANLAGVRPERYVRQFYRYLNRLFR